MLEELLKIIRGGGSWTTNVLALRLGTSVGLVEVMMEHLERLGLVHQFDAVCADSCNQCALGETCNPSGKTSLHLWTV